MVRPFAIRDVNTLRRINGNSVPMFMRLALTERSQTISSALKYKMAGLGYPTFVSKSADSDTIGYGQLQLPKNGTYANLLHAGVYANKDDTVWLELLDGVVFQAGKKGAHGVIAEIDDGSEIFPILRKAGFAVNTRQDIWMVCEETAVSSSDLPVFTKSSSEDDWDVEILYANLTPPLVRMVEPIPSIYGHEVWVLREGDELVAYADIYQGSDGSWLQIYIHPNAETEADAVVAAASKLVEPSKERPLYCCVRRYQSWLSTALEKAGYQHHSSQAVMVKHTVTMTKHKPQELNELLEKNPAMAKPTTFVRRIETAKPKKELA